jgi:1,4-dihydroxy-6-naphthoate synthase
MIRIVSRHLRASIAYGLANREAALEHAMSYARGLDQSKADEFVGMYVNDWTLDYGPQGRRAVQLLLDLGFEKGIIPHRVPLEFIDDA